MKKIICTSSLHSVGATFVNWSIHFLSGHDQFYSVKNQAWIPVVSNPVSKINAHGHDKNHPSGLAGTQSYVEQFRRTPGDLFSFYPFPMHADVACQQLGHGIPEQLDPKLTQQIQSYRCKDWTNMINYCLEQDLKVIYVELAQQNLLYSQAIRSLGSMFSTPRRAQTAQETTTHVVDLFFQNDYKTWQRQGLDNVWDQREFLALCCRPFDNSYQNWQFDRTRPHLWIGSESMWYNGLETIQRIMDFCELPIDQARLNSWLVVYREWQQIQLNILEFTFNYQHIVDAIVNNWYYKLDNLTFEQEIIIQHCLIYQHELNLQTWQLEKFPGNTQQLHQLLEPNIHKIDLIY
jgi:hypothetical protein